MRGGRGGGVDHVPKVLRHFLHKYWEFWALKKFIHGCPKRADTKATSQYPKLRGGGQGHFKTMSKRKVLFYVFPKEKKFGGLLQIVLVKKGPKNMFFSQRNIL